MKPTHFVKITIPCQSAEEMLQAKEAVLFHLETLNPGFSVEGTTLTAKVVPLDLNCLYNKFPRRSRKLIRAEVV